MIKLLLIINNYKNYANVYHRYLPIDVDFLISKFFKLWKVLMEKTSSNSSSWKGNSVAQP